MSIAGIWGVDMSKRNDVKLRKTSKFISLILRHKPETIGISVDEHGWAVVDDLISGINENSRHRINREILEEIVRTDEKQRYSFDEEHRLIRANQGCGRPVDDPAKPEHRPSREARPFNSGRCGIRGKDPSGYSLARNRG